MTRASLVAAFLLAVAVASLAPPDARAQVSAGFQNRENVFNAGAAPAPILSSPNYELTLASIGDGLVAAGMSADGYRMDGGFGLSYPPPADVQNLRFTSKTAFAWDAELSVGSYNVYRGLLASLPSGYGSCFAHGLTTPQGTDAAAPPSGEGYFYLVTAENRIAEEGTMGSDSIGTPRPNTAPCP